MTAAISGLFDLEPISLSWLNDKLQLTPTEIDDYSPLRHIGRGTRTIMSVGSAELPELVRHSTEYTEACQAKGEAATCLTVAGCTHFRILEDLATPNSAILGAVVEAMGSACAVESPDRIPTAHLALDNTVTARKEKS